MSEEWIQVDGTDAKGKRMEDEEQPITDICLLSKKERVPTGFTVLEQTLDGKKVDFAEGMFGSTKRYLAYSRKVPSLLRGRIVLTDLKVGSNVDQSPLGYLPLTHTHDDNTKAFSSRVLAIKVGAHEQTAKAITDIVILSANRKEDCPPGYLRLLDINGFSICYKVANVGRRRGSQSSSTSQPKPSETPAKDTIVHQQSVVKTFRPATDGLQFKLGPMMDHKHYLIEHALGDLNTLSLDDVEKYEADFSKYHKIANTT